MAHDAKYRVRTAPAVYVESETGYRGVLPNIREVICKEICEASGKTVKPEQLVFKGESDTPKERKPRGGK